MSADAVRNALVDVFRGNTNVTNGFKFQLTGTLTFTQNSTTVAGVGTSFRPKPNEQLGAAKKGDYIRATTSTKWYKVKSVESETSLTLDEVVAEATETGVVGYVLHLGIGGPRSFDFFTEVRGIKIFHMAEIFKPNTLPNTRQDVIYGFLASAFFFESDDSEIEIKKDSYA